MTGIGKSLSEYKEKQLAKLTREELPTYVIAERLGINSSQVYYHQKRLGIWKGVKKWKKNLVKDDNSN